MFQSSLYKCIVIGLLFFYWERKKKYYNSEAILFNHYWVKLFFLIFWMCSEFDFQTECELNFEQASKRKLQNLGSVQSLHCIVFTLSSSLESFGPGFFFWRFFLIISVYATSVLFAQEREYREFWMSCPGISILFTILAFTKATFTFTFTCNRCPYPEWLTEVLCILQQQHISHRSTNRSGSFKIPLC